MTDLPQQLKAAYFTLGCKLNYAETSTIGRLLAEKGIARAGAGEVPDLCIVNTCSVTQEADKKGRRLIRGLAKKYPEASIIVTGCYAQLKPEEVAALPGVDIVLGSNEKLRIADYIDSLLKEKSEIIETTPSLQIKEFMPSCERGDRTRFFLKIQDGCDYFCTYCTIPFARGRSRSGTIRGLVDLAKETAAKGGKEIVITGVNIGEFGKDNGQDFFSLLKELDKVEGIERYRISSIEPNLLSDDIIKWIANESRAYMPHFHIPLQSGSDKVLRLMNRRYDTGLFRSRIETIRSLMPDAFIGVDIIAGARGETPEEWEKSLDFARSLDISKFHVFPYSERPGTKALLIGEPVETGEKHRRVAQLTALSDEKNKAFILANLGKTRKVLWEKTSGKDILHGLTDNYIRVEAPFIPDMVNRISSLRLDKLNPSEKDLITGSHA